MCIRDSVRRNMSNFSEPICDLKSRDRVKLKVIHSFSPRYSITLPRCVISNASFVLWWFYYNVCLQVEQFCKGGAKKRNSCICIKWNKYRSFFVVHSNHRRSSSTTICGTRDMISSKAEDKGCCLGVNRSPVFFVHMEPMCCLSAKWLCSPLPDGSNTQSLCDFIRPDKTWNFCSNDFWHSHVLRELHRQVWKTK